MNYHPIMGILILILCVFLAYLIGKLLLKKYFKMERTDIDSKQSVDIGDANSPDAPWMKDKK